MDKICVIDTETTGLDVSNGHVLEVGAVFFNIPTRSILSQASTLCYAEENPAIEINRIEVESLKAIPPKMEALSRGLIREMMRECDAIIAHNAEFDKKWIETLVEFQEISQSKPWICTRNDVIWPIRKGIPLNLIHICVDLGVPVINAHRALGDCLLLIAALDSMDDIEFFLDKSGKGRIRYHAEIGYENRSVAKEMGFQWDNFKKVWFAKMKPEDAERMPFTVYPAESVPSKSAIEVP